MRFVYHASSESYEFMSNASEKFWNINQVSAWVGGNENCMNFRFTGGFEVIRLPRWMPRIFSFTRKLSHRSRTSSGGLWMLKTNRHKLIAISKLNIRAPSSRPKWNVNRYNNLKRSMDSTSLPSSFWTICNSRCRSSLIVVALSFFSPCMNSCFVKQHICFASRQNASTSIGKESGEKLRSRHNFSTPSVRIRSASFLSLYSSYNLLIALSANCDSLAANKVNQMIINGESFDFSIYPIKLFVSHQLNYSYWWHYPPEICRWCFQNDSSWKLVNLWFVKVRLFLKEEDKWWARSLRCTQSQISRNFAMKSFLPNRLIFWSESCWFVGWSDLKQVKQFPMSILKPTNVTAPW